MLFRSEAGLPLLNALKTVRRQAHGKAQPVILDFIIERVESGRPLHEAMDEYGPPFDEMIVGMVRASGASGRMPEVMHQLADLLDRTERVEGLANDATALMALIDERMAAQRQPRPVRR